MTRIRFEDLPSTNTPRNAENLNKLNNVVISTTEPTTGEEVWIDDVNKKIYVKNDNGVYEEFYNGEEPQWKDIPYENGYSSLDENSWNKLQYKQKGKQVFLRGMIKNSNANPSGANATCGILPQGARPMKGLYLAGSQGDATVRHIDVVVNNNGQIQVYNTLANVWLSLDGLSFFID